jgi:tetratricopeptide (TPR) repeat protein
MQDRLTLVLRGQFAVLSEDGHDLTPSSGKACAILVLLATAPQMRRSRLWLQQMLWSGRAPAQASGSLRQSLVEIRRALRQYAPVLKASRSTVMLEPGAIPLVDGLSEAFADRDFLQGFPALDPGFDGWLRQMRERGADAKAAVSAGERFLRQRPSPPQRMIVLIQLGAAHLQDVQNLLLFMREFIGRSLTELHELSVVHEQLKDNAIPTGVPTLRVEIGAFEITPGSLSLNASIEECATLRMFWSRMSSPVSAESFNADINGCLAFAQGVIQAASNIMASEPLLPTSNTQHAASVFAATAVRRMFSMRRSEIEAAQGLLDRALEIHPRGLYHAQRAQLAIIQLIERQTDDAHALRDQARHDIAIAMEKEPLNSNVLAAAAHSQNVFEHDNEASIWLAQQSIEANRANPVGWLVLSNALLYAGRTSDAYDAALTAQGLADQTWLKHWMYFQRSLAAAVSGRFTEAAAFGSRAHLLAPHFRPPLRYLVALHARSAEFGRSAEAARRLVDLEPDFSVRRLASDRDYPASFLHRANLIGPSDVEQIEAG